MAHDFEDRAVRGGASLRLALGLLLTAGLSTSVGCGDDEGNDKDCPEFDGGTDGDGDMMNPGDGDGDMMNPGDGDGDGDQGDGDGDDVDAGIDAGDGDGDSEEDAGTDAGPEGPEPDDLRPLGLAGSDRFAAAAFSPDGTKIYAVGYLTLPTANASVLNRAMSVARFNLDNTLDTTFSEDGILWLDFFAPTGTSDASEGAKAVTVQPDGKVLVAGTYKWGDAFVSAQAKDNNDVLKTAEGLQPLTGVAVVRLNTDGTVDETFNAAGNRKGWFTRDLRPMQPTASYNATQQAVVLSSRDDDVGGVSVDSQGRVVVFAKGEAAAGGHAQRIVFRLTDAGAVDASFGTAGFLEFGVAAAHENAKQGAILSSAGNVDDIMSPGYTNVAGKNTIVAAYIESDGTLKDGWGDFTLNSDDEKEDVNGTDDYLASNPFIEDGGFVEAYAAALQKDQEYFVTTGYGYKEATTSSTRVLYSFRYSVATGARDRTFGNHADGYFYLDNIVAGTTAGSIQGRAAVVLDDDRIVMAGNALPNSANSATTGADGFVAVLTEEGELDTTFNTTGVQTWDVGLTSDQFAGLAAHGNTVVAVGYSGGNAASATKEESAIVILDLTPAP